MTNKILELVEQNYLKKDIPQFTRRRHRGRAHPHHRR